MSKIYSEKDLSIGFIGLGAMGLPMVMNLIQAGFNVKVYNRTLKESLYRELADTKYCSSPEEVSIGVDILLICVSNDYATDNVLFGSNGAYKSLEKGSIVVDLSTISPGKARDNSTRLSKIDVNYFDAPVTGGTEGAKSGSLSILLGGKEELLEKIYPILKHLGSSIAYFGGVGKGQEVKAINQILISGIFGSLAEAIVLGEKLNLPMKDVINALSNGAASSWVLKNRSIGMINDHYPLGFKLELHHKDLMIALNCAEMEGIDLPIARKIKELESKLIKKGIGRLDMSAIKKAYN